MHSSGLISEIPSRQISPEPIPSAKSLTIGIPCYNEASTIGKVVDDFKRLFWKARILVIDNASTDATAEIARQHGADVIQEPRKGKGNAVQRLFREVHSEYLIMVDGDDTYPAEEALKLIATIEKEGGDTIVGRRASEDRAAFKTLHTWANEFLSRFIAGIFHANVGDLFSGYRLFTKTFYKCIPVLATGFEVEAEIALQTIDKGFTQREVTISFRSRPEGSFSKLNTVQDGLRVLWVIFSVIKDFKPLLFFSTLAAFLFAFSLGAGSFPMWDYIEYRYVFHVPLSVLATGLTLLAALSLTCGLVLDTIVRYSREQFLIQIRNFQSAPPATTTPLSPL